MLQFLSHEWFRCFVQHFKVLPRFNRASDGTSEMPMEPLCYLDMDQPLVATINPASWSKQAPRAGVDAIGPVRTLG